MKPPPWIQIGTLFLYGVLCSTLPLQAAPEESLREAALYYEKGERTEQFEERKEAFNRALSLYHAAEREGNEANASLNQALGDTYLELGEYPWAILYYRRALFKTWHNPTLEERLKRVEERLGIVSFLELPLTRLLSLPPVLDFLFFLLLAWIFLLGSLFIWLPRRFFRPLALAGTLVPLFAVLILWTLQLSTQVQGVLVQADGMRDSADQHATESAAYPLPAGSTVTLLQLAPGGGSVRVKDATNREGYISTASLRLVNARFL